MTTKFLIGVELEKRKSGEAKPSLEDFFELATRAGARIVRVDTVLDERLLPAATQKQLALPAPKKINGHALKGAMGIIQKLLAEGPVHKDVVTKRLLKHHLSAGNLSKALYIKKIARLNADGLIEAVDQPPAAPKNLADAVVQAIQLAGIPIGKTKIAEHLAALNFSRLSAGTAIMLANKQNLLVKHGAGNRTVYSLRQQQKD